jgi:hypothetical protein
MKKRQHGIECARVMHVDAIDTPCEKGAQITDLTRRSALDADHESRV